MEWDELEWSRLDGFVHIVKLLERVLTLQVVVDGYRIGYHGY
jgi:hypothetical protein